MAKKVLIFDDNDLNRKLFNDVLSSEGYETLTSNGDDDALDLARRLRPDLIVMDINMPETDGLEATRRIKRDDETRGIPVIAVTACAMAGDEDRIRAEGCSDYIAKPVSLSGFLSSVRRHLY